MSGHVRAHCATKDIAIGESATSTHELLRGRERHLAMGAGEFAGTDRNNSPENNVYRS